MMSKVAKLRQKMELSSRDPLSKRISTCRRHCKITGAGNNVRRHANLVQPGSGVKIHGQLDLPQQA